MRASDCSADRPSRTLPRTRLGTPPGRPPGIARRVPRLGRIGVPPELRRRTPGATRSLPAAAVVSDRIRGALQKAQQKLLDSQRKLKTSVGALRGVLTR